MPIARKDHGEPVLVGSRDDLFVSNRAPWMDCGRGSIGRSFEKPVREWKEGIRGDHAAVEIQLGLLAFGDGNLLVIDTAHLTGAYTDGLAILGIDDCVTLHVFGHSPRKIEVFPLFLGGLALGDHGAAGFEVLE